MGIMQDHALARAEADTCSFFRCLYFRLNAGELTRSAFDGATGDMAARFAMEGASAVKASEDAQAVRSVAALFISQALRPPPGVAYDPKDVLFGLVHLDPPARLKFVRELVIEYGGHIEGESDKPE